MPTITSAMPSALALSPANADGPTSTATPAMPSTPHFKHDLHIAAHVRACAHDGQVVLLDLQRSRYLGVGGPLAATLAPVVSGWPGHDNCPHVGTASQANTEALAHATAADVEAELKRIGHELRPLDIVIVNTSAGARFGQQNYVASGCGMGYEATMHLVDRGVKVTGTDGWSWDAPFVHTAKKYAETKNAALIWEGHKAGRHKGYCHIEKLHNLEQLPATGFMVSCFPVKIERASAGWTRAVAIIEE